MSNKPNRRPTNQTSARVAAARDGGNSRPWLIPVVVIAVLAVGILAVILARSSSTSEDAANDPSTTAEPPTISGASLPKFPDAPPDPAVGKAMPIFKGEDTTGKPLTVGPNGKPRVIIYLAHWCPHCQAEVKTMTPWLTQNNPSDVDIQAVTTALDPKAPNYPPGSWLKREGWPIPTLVDTSNEVAEASGLSGYPFWVFVDANNNVTKRTSGEMTPEQFQTELDALRAGSSASTPGTAGPASPAK